MYEHTWLRSLASDELLNFMFAQKLVGYLALLVNTCELGSAPENSSFESQWTGGGQLSKKGKRGWHSPNLRAESRGNEETGRTQVVVLVVLWGVLPSGFAAHILQKKGGSELFTIDVAAVRLERKEYIIKGAVSRMQTRTRWRSCADKVVKVHPFLMSGTLLKVISSSESVQRRCVARVSLAVMNRSVVSIFKTNERVRKYVCA